MKTIYKIAVIFSLLSGIYACNDDFIDRYPLDKLNDETYWKSVSDLKTYANQFYPNLSTLSGYDTDNSSDNQAPATKVPYIWNEYTVPISGDGWGKDDWKNIRSCNFFLQRYHTAVGLQSQIDVYVGEVLFFKSMFYYDKVVRYGDVPWYDKDLQTSSEELYAPRDSRKLVMDSICSSLDRAIRYLPETSTDGRLTRYTALALKSRICLFEGTYRKYHNLGDETPMLRQSADAAWAIISSGKFGIYSTGNPEQDYHSFFQLHDMKGINEVIFYSQYEKDLRMHNRSRATGGGGTGMTKDFVESYLCSTDGLPIALSSGYKGDQNFTDEFVNRDLRMKQTIYTPDQPSQITINGDTIREDGYPIFQNNYVTTGYRMYKMYSPLAIDNEYMKCTIDDCVFRYAEVLLNYAEAKAELGECDQEVIDQTVKLLRDRVDMPNMILPISFVDPNWPAWETPVSPLINEIRRERRIELACEGFRFTDLKRWNAGKLLDNKKTYLGARDPQTNTYREIYPGMERKWADRLYLYPLPNEELTLNPNLVQNPGWN